MKTIFKYAATVALTGALALAAASPGEARNGRNAAAIGLGVGAAVAGAAIASSAYNNGYYDITAIRVTPMARATLMRRAMPMTTHTPMRRRRPTAIAPTTMATGGRINTAPTISRLTRSDRLRGKSGRREAALRSGFFFMGDRPMTHSAHSRVSGNLEIQTRTLLPGSPLSRGRTECG